LILSPYGRGRAAAHLERQAHEQELLAQQLVEIAQLLDHADALLQPDLVGRPPPLVRIVHADEIGGEDRDVAVDEPLRGVGRHERPLHDEVRGLPLLVGAGPADGRFAAADLLTGFLLGGFEVGDGDRLAVLAMGEVEQMAGQHGLGQRHLVDRLAVLVEMARCVDVGAAMLGHQHHLAFGGELAAGDLARVLEGLERPEAADVGAEIGHVVVVLVAEIDDFLEVRLHGLTPPCCIEQIA
jgi:hypothetical protein